MSQASPASHHSRLAVAERIIPVVGGLYRDNGVVTHIHGRSLIGCSPEQLLKAHRFARHAGGEELDVEQTLELLSAISALNPGAANVDVGAIVAQWRTAGKKVALTFQCLYILLDFWSVLNVSRFVQERILSTDSF